MFTFSAIRRSLGIAALVGGLFAGSADRASACDYTWKTITVYVTVQQPKLEYVTQYDDCGRAFVAKKTTIRTVRVPVEKRIKVYH